MDQNDLFNRMPWMVPILQWSFSRFTLYSLYNNFYIPFTTMMSAMCDFIGGIGISTGIHVIHFESIVFNKFDYIQPIYNIIEYVESFLPHFAATPPSSLQYDRSNVSH
jgi:hypothetical protein